MLFALAGVVVAGLPVVVWIVYSQCDFITTNTHCEAQIGWLIASCFVGVTLPISIWEIIMRLRHMHSPMLQVGGDRYRLIAARRRWADTRVGGMVGHWGGGESK